MRQMMMSICSPAASVSHTGLGGYSLKSADSLNETAIVQMHRSAGAIRLLSRKMTVCSNTVQTISQPASGVLGDVHLGLFLA